LALGAEHCLKVIVWIGNLITSAPVTDLEIAGILVGAINEVVCCAAGREPEAHAGLEVLLAIVGRKHKLALENIDKFILPAMAVEEGG
jgi:hypothetical protein